MGRCTNSSTPVAARGIASATAVTAGWWHHSCARLADGTVQCWGANEWGQFGNGTTTGSASPVAMSGAGVLWTSSNTAVATIDSAGRATGTGAGTTTITATDQSGASASTVLTVRQPPQPVVLTVNKSGLASGLGTVDLESAGHQLRERLLGAVRHRHGRDADREPRSAAHRLERMRFGVRRDVHGDHGLGTVGDRDIRRHAVLRHRRSRAVNGLIHMMFEDIRQVVAELEADIAGGAIVPAVLPDEIRDYLASRYNFSNAPALDDVIADVAGMMRRWHVQVTHPRYFGLFNPSVTLPSVIADTLTAMYNPQLATWRTSPAANEIERHTLAWLAGKFGLPASTIAHFTTGGAEANLSAVVVALARRFPQWGDGGLRGLPASPAIYLTGDAHGSFGKIARVTGLGCGHCAWCPSMPTGAWTWRISRGGSIRIDGTGSRRSWSSAPPARRRPAPSIRSPSIARFCRSEGLWFHVDAAWGGAAVLSPRLRGAPRWHRGGRLDHLRCAQVVLGADGRGHVLLPASGRRSRRLPGAHRLHAAGHRRSDRRSVRDAPPVVAAVHRAETVPRARRSAASAATSRRSSTRRAWATCCASRSRAPAGRSSTRTPLPLVCFTRDGLAVSRFVADLCERQIAWMSEVRLGDVPLWCARA